MQRKFLQNPKENSAPIFMNTQHCIINYSKAHVNKMKSTQTMTKEELYNIGACDYDSVYMSQVRIG